MFQIRPQETFPIVYTLSDPSDTNTYYVRAVIRNSVSGAVININGLAYVNLTDLGSRRFAKSIQAPDDSSGQGFWIDVTVSVYTDAGYTTKSSAYQEENNKYLVEQRWNTALGGGGGNFIPPGGGVSHEIDYKKLVEMVILAFNSLPTTELPVIDLSGVYAQGDAIREMIKDIKIPPVDLETFAKFITQTLSAEIRAKEIPPVDIESVKEKIDGIEFPEAIDYAPYFQSLQSELENLNKKFSHYDAYLKTKSSFEKIIKQFPQTEDKAPSEAISQDKRLRALLT